jgi:hypothetical protein
MTKDAIVLKTTSAGDFAEVDTIVGGTGGWAGSTFLANALILDEISFAQETSMV